LRDGCSSGADDTRQAIAAAVEEQSSRATAESLTAMSGDLRVG
jgi:hypothetical protein